MLVCMELDCEEVLILVETELLLDWVELDCVLVLVWEELDCEEALVLVMELLLG